MEPASNLRQTCDSVPELVFQAVRAGIALIVDGDSLRIKGPKEARSVGEQLVARKPEVLEWLRAWQPGPLAALESETDGMIGQLRVSGFDEVISAAASRCVAARQWRDTVGVVAACREIQARARELAAGRQI